jgi:hypothetical protein
MSGRAASAKSESVQGAGKTLTRRAIQPTWFGPIPGGWHWFVNICVRKEQVEPIRKPPIQKSSQRQYCTRPTKRMTGRMSLTQSQVRSKPIPPLTRFQAAALAFRAFRARNARTSQRRPRQKSWHHLLNIPRPRK